jgi:hypothetical protein
LSTSLVQDLASDALAILDVDASADDRADAVRRTERHAATLVRRLEPSRRSSHTPFHWLLRFPEVFDDGRGGFDAIVGNPPFLGNKYWKASLGSEVQLAKELLTGADSGKIDLATLFLRRSVQLLTAPGHAGLLGTSKLCEGESLDAGLAEVSKECVIYRATTAFPWPGSATISAVVVWFAQPPYLGRAILDGAPVDKIKPRLEAGADDLEAPVPLKSGLVAFEGVHNGRGLAFTVTLDDPWYSRLRADGAGLFQPYLSGDDLLSHGLQRIERWAVFTRDLTLDEVRSQSDAVYRFLIERVKPTRTTDQLTSYKGLAERWWQYWNNRAEGYHSISGEETCIVVPKICKRIVAARAPSSWVYTNKFVVIREFGPGALAVFLSGLFSSWAEAMSGSHMGSGVSLDLGRAVLTFPPPPHAVEPSGVAAADQFQERAAAWCVAAHSGYTELYNRLHDCSELDTPLVQMRRDLAAVDVAVACAYGSTAPEALVRRLDLPEHRPDCAATLAMRSAHLRLVRSVHEEHLARENRGGMNGRA